MKNITILLFLLSASFYAQDSRHEKIKALKTAFITEELNLSTAEAEKFWPVYNAYAEKMHSIRMQERNEIFAKIKNGGLENITDAQANALIDKGMSLENEALKNNNELIKNLRNVISAKKIIKLKKVEEDFKRQLLERYRQHKKNKD